MSNADHNQKSESEKRFKYLTNLEAIIVWLTDHKFLMVWIN